MTDCYQIAKWEVFEAVESRRPDGPMGWFAHPVTMSSRGRVWLLRQGQSGIEALAIFPALVAIAAQKHRPQRDGALTHSDGSPMDAGHIAFVSGFSEQAVERALETLANPACRWLIEQDTAVIDQERSMMIKSDQERSKIASTLQDRTLQNNKTPLTPRSGGMEDRASAAEEPETIPDDVLDAWDRHRRGRMPEAVRPPDQATVRRWTRCGRPSAELVADRTKKAASSTRYHSPDRDLPLNLPKLLSGATWAEIGAMTPPKDQNAAQAKLEAFSREVAAAEKAAAPPDTVAAILGRSKMRGGTSHG